MQQKQAKNPNKDDGTSQAFNDVLKSLVSVIGKLITQFPALVGVFILALSISVYLILRAINSDYTYSLTITFLFMFLSFGLYFKDKSILNAIIAFSLGIFTAFTVPWNSSTFTIFVICFVLLFIILFLIHCIRLAADVEEKHTKASISYINDIETNKKDLKEVADIIMQHKHDKGGVLSASKIYDAILYFAYHKVPKSRMIILITALSYIHPMTKVDVESVLPLLANINYASRTEVDLGTNLQALHKYFREAHSSPNDLVKLLNDALPIAIENDIDFVVFADVIMTYLSRGYSQASILEKLSWQFTKKTP
jgi:hypothetical protein